MQALTAHSYLERPSQNLWHLKPAHCPSTLQSQTESVIAFLSNETSVKQLRQDKAYNLQLLQQQFQIGPPQIEALYFYAKFQFDCGSYSDAAETLFHCR